DCPVPHPVVQRDGAVALRLVDVDGGAAAQHRDVHRLPQLLGERVADRPRNGGQVHARSEEHTSELQSRFDLVCRLLLEQKKPESPVRPGIPSKGVRGCSYGAWRLSPPMHTAPSAAQMAAYLPAIAETTERYVTGTERAT